MVRFSIQVWMIEAKTYYSHCHSVLLNSKWRSFHKKMKEASLPSCLHTVNRTKVLNPRSPGNVLQELQLKLKSPRLLSITILNLSPPFPFFSFLSSLHSLIFILSLIFCAPLFTCLTPSILHNVNLSLSLSLSATTSPVSH